MKYFFLSFSLFFPVFCFSQMVLVIDAQTQEKLEQVLIISIKNNLVVSTDSNGLADINQLKNEEELEIRRFGYKSLFYSYHDLAKGNKPIFLFPEPFNIEKVIISASRWKQPQKNIPHKISTLTNQDFLFQNSQTSADLLATSGDVFIQKSQQGGGSPMIRGFATNRLLYSIDGTRMNTAIFRSGNLQNVISLDAFATESVEIFFGPGSVLYGSDAIGGVMSFQTRNPFLSTDSAIKVNGGATLRTSSANSEITSHLDLSIATKRFGFLSSFSRSDFGDLIMGTDGPSEFLRDSAVVRSENKDVIVSNNNARSQIPTDYEQINFMQKVMFQAKEGLTFLYGFHFSETSHYARFDRLIQQSGNQFRFAENEYGPQKWQMHQLRVSQDNESSWYDKAKLNIAFQQFEESRIDRLFGDSIRRRRVENVDAYSINLDFIKKIKGKHVFYYGLEGVYNKVESKGSSFNLTTLQKEAIQSRYPNSDWFSNAIYLSHQYSHSSKLMFEGGLRLNQYALNSNFDTSFVSLPFDNITFNNFSFNGSIGATYLPTEKWSLSLKLSSGFRSPNVDDIGKFFDPEPFSVVVPNEQLKAETAYNIDMGISKIFGSHFRADVTLFYTLLNDALVRRDFNLNGSDSLFFDGENKKVQAIQNAAKATVYGVQFVTELKINKQFNWENQLSMQEGEEELQDGRDTPSRHVAPLFGASKLNYKRKKYTLQLSLNYSGEIAFKDLNIGEQAKPHLYAADVNGNPYSPSWYTINLKGQYFINTAFVATAGIENISNQRYRTYSSGIAAAGRNVTFAIAAKF